MNITIRRDGVLKFLKDINYGDVFCMENTNPEETTFIKTALMKATASEDEPLTTCINLLYGTYAAYSEDTPVYPVNAELIVTPMYDDYED